MSKKPKTLHICGGELGMKTFDVLNANEVAHLARFVC
jgi:hypothetical protein